MEGGTRPRRLSPRPHCDGYRLRLEAEGSKGTQFSVLGSQFSVLGSQFSVLGSQFSVLSSQFSVLSSRFSVLSSRFLVLVTGNILVLPSCMI
jgi:hypothetical protein